MKFLNTIYMAALVLSLVMLVQHTEAARPRKRQQRGYRSGVLDPKKMMNKTFTSMDARKGSIETLDYLPAIEFYDNTFWTFENRKEMESKYYKPEDLKAFDHYLKNMTETSREMHDFYIADPDTGKYLFPNQSYLILFGAKDD